MEANYQRGAADQQCQPERAAREMPQMIGAAAAIGLSAGADPWKHRSDGMRCRTCMWFAHKQPDPVAAAPQLTRRGDVGRCRRHAPTMGGYPVVFVNDWCGDHRLNENAI